VIDAIGMNGIGMDEYGRVRGRMPSGEAPGAAGLQELDAAELEAVEGGNPVAAGAAAFVAGAALGAVAVGVGFAAGVAVTLAVTK
jgi:hypothetical protein